MTFCYQPKIGLASKFTSYVAVDPKEQKELKESWMMMKSRDVPVQVAHGWGGMAMCNSAAPQMLYGGGMPMARSKRSAPMPMALGYSASPLPQMMMMKSAANSAPLMGKYASAIRFNLY